MKNNNKNLEHIIEFLHEAGRLKTTYRFGANKLIKGDSSADHSWRLSIMAFLLAEELELKIDKYKALKIALVHDLAEALTGDIDVRTIEKGKVSKDQKIKQETRAIKMLISLLPKNSGQEIGKLWNDYEIGGSEEARFIKALDKLETQIKTLEEGYKKFDMPDLIGQYGRKEVGKYKALYDFFKLVKVKLKKEFKKGNIPWKKEYEEIYK